jgi:UDP-N-acetylglucosamine diphosphorylase/glucosamine-1-phosphate N-acetyltransferase
MRICVFEDRGVEFLAPLSLTRPVFDLWCGASSLLSRQVRHVSAKEIGLLVRPTLASLCRLTHAGCHVNDFAWLRAAGAVLLNGRWLPPLEPAADHHAPHVGLVGDEVAYAVLPAELLTYCSPNTIDDCMETWKQRLPLRPAGGWMIDFPWDLIACNAAMMRQDCARSIAREGRSHRPSGLGVVGPSDLLRVHPTARINPFVAVDTTQGPVLIDHDAVVHSFSRLQGPCCIGPHSQVLGARIRSSSIGPMCRVGGEVEASILLGYVNKHHDGFAGHSYIGAWVNLAAGVQISDLRHDYQPVRMTIAGRSVDTGMTKLGAIIGDHTKVGLDVLLNTGSVIGAFCNLLPSGGYLPRTIPSFCAWWNGTLTEQTPLPALLAAARAVMQRRGCDLTSQHIALIHQLRDQTAAQRHQALRQGEQPRLRLSA